MKRNRQARWHRRLATRLRRRTGGRGNGIRLSSVRADRVSRLLAELEQDVVLDQVQPVSGPRPPSALREVREAFDKDSLNIKRLPDRPAPHALDEW